MTSSEYDLILQGGHVIDPANDVHGIRDVAISGGRIAAVAPNLPAERARKAISVAGSRHRLIEDRATTSRSGMSSIEGRSIRSRISLS